MFVVGGIHVSPSFFLPGIKHAPMVCLAPCGHQKDSEEYRTLPQFGSWSVPLSVLSRMKPSSWVPQEGPRELQADWDPATPGSELGVPPNGVPTTQEGLKQQGSGKETEDQQESQRNPETMEGQGPESRQVMSTESQAGRDGMANSQGRWGSRELLKAGRRLGFWVKLKTGHAGFNKAQFFFLILECSSSCFLAADLCGTLQEVVRVWYLLQTYLTIKYLFFLRFRFFFF